MDARPDKPHIPYRRPSDGVAATPTTTTTEEYDNRHRPILDLNDPMVRARYEAVESAAGMARIAMAIGDRGMLRTACIEGLKASEAVGIKATPLGDVSLAEAGVSLRTCNAIEGALGATTIAEILAYSPAELICGVDNFGERTVREMVRKLREFAELRGEKLEQVQGVQYRCSSGPETPAKSGPTKSAVD